VYTSFTFTYVLLYFSPVLPNFYITFFIFYYTLFNIYQLNLTVTNYQNSYPSYQKSYPTVTTVIIPTLLSDYHFPRKIRTYSRYLPSPIFTRILPPSLLSCNLFRTRYNMLPLDFKVFLIRYLYELRPPPRSQRHCPAAPQFHHAHDHRFSALDLPQRLPYPTLPRPNH